jgi:4-amino-4-deoxy-L-arabinose transferase-like glycosyltransferase
LLIDQYRNSGRRSLQLSAAFACGIACLARYPGVALVVAGIIVPLWPGQRWRRRLVDTGIFMVFAAAPPTAWLVRNAAVSGSATARDLLLHSIPYWKWMTGLDTLAS